MTGSGDRRVVGAAGVSGIRAIPLGSSVVTTGFVENNPENCAAKMITTMPAAAAANRA
jgi:hypothetical protein